MQVFQRSHNGANEIPERGMRSTERAIQHEASTFVPDRGRRKRRGGQSRGDAVSPFDHELAPDKLSSPYSLETSAHRVKRHHSHSMSEASLTSSGSYSPSSSPSPLLGTSAAARGTKHPGAGQAKSFASISGYRVRDDGQGIRVEKGDWPWSVVDQIERVAARENQRGPAVETMSERSPTSEATGTNP